MDKNEFMGALSARLSYMHSDEIERTLSFYVGSIEDRIEDGMSEADAVAAMGSIDSIVSNIEMDMPLTSLVKTKIRNSHEKSKNKTLWLVLAICGAPFWVPIAFALVAVMFAVYVCVWAAIISLFAALLSLAIASIVGFIVGIIRCFIFSPVTGTMIIGMAISCAGLFLICLLPVISLSRALIHLTYTFFRSVKRFFVTERGVA